VVASKAISDGADFHLLSYVSLKDGAINSSTQPELFQAAAKWHESLTAALADPKKFKKSAELFDSTECAAALEKDRALFKTFRQVPPYVRISVDPPSSDAVFKALIDAAGKESAQNDFTVLWISNQNADRVFASFDQSCKAKNAAAPSPLNALSQLKTDLASESSPASDLDQQIAEAQAKLKMLEAQKTGTEQSSDSSAKNLKAPDARESAGAVTMNESAGSAF
jgi:hypothetical protein